MVMSMGTVKRVVVLGKDHLFSALLLHPDPLPFLAADCTFSGLFVLHLLSVLLLFVVVVVVVVVLLVLLLRSPNPSLLLT
jgi:hypothetical protein